MSNTNIQPFVNPTTKKQIATNLKAAIETRDYLRQWYTTRSKSYSEAARLHRVRPIALEALVAAEQQIKIVNNEIKNYRRKLAR